MQSSKRSLWFVGACLTLAVIGLIVAVSLQDKLAVPDRPSVTVREGAQSPHKPGTTARKPGPAPRKPGEAPQPGETTPEERTPGAPGLFDLAAWNAWLAALPEKDKKFAVRLQSRFFLPEPEGEIHFKTDHKRIVLQFEDIPTDEQQAELKRYGVVLERYLDSYSYLTYVLRDTFEKVRALPYVHGVAEISGADKMPGAVWGGNYGEWARTPEGVTLEVQFFSSVSFRQAQEALAANGLTTDATDFEFNHKLTLKTGAEAVKVLAEEDSIEYVDQLHAPPEASNATAAGLHKVNQINASPYNLNGSGVKVGEWDEGPPGSHTDYNGRVTVVDGSSTVSNHGTHVCGTIIGSGAGNGQAKGMATAATLFFGDWNNPFAEMATAFANNGISFSTNSWSFIDTPGAYSSQSQNADAVLVPGSVTSPRKITVLFAAGNDRNGTDTYKLIRSLGCSKNTVTIAALNDDGSMSSFSSFGPSSDGRIKPDVSANGVGLSSTQPNNAYASFSGTSMATPATTGAATLLVQLYRQKNGGADPPSGLIKDLLIHNAIDKGPAGPDYKFGYGLIDAKACADQIIADADPNLAHFATGQVSNGGSMSFQVTVPTGFPALKATLVWMDPPGSPSATLARVNDLDLEALSPSNTTFFPFVGPGASNPSGATTTGHNDVDVVEQVLVAAPQAGTWTIKVKGHVVPTGPQPFVLIVSPGMGAASFFSISGATRNSAGGTIGGTTVTLGGGASATVTSDGSGNYSFPSLAAGSYSLSAQKAGFAFTPAQIDVSLTNANVTGQDFSGTVSNSSIVTKDENPDLPIPDNSASGVSSSLTFSSHVTIGEVNVFVDLAHAFLSALRIKVTSPAGTTVILRNTGTGPSGPGAIQTFYDTQTPSAEPLSAFNGQDAFGAWTLNVADVDDFGDTGTLNLWKLEVVGGTTAPVIAAAPSNLNYSGVRGGPNPASQTLSISNGGTGTLSWTVSDDATWLTLAPLSGTNAGSVTASVNTSGLAAGSFTGSITVSATGAANTPVTIPVSLTVTNPTTTPVVYTKDENPDLFIPDNNSTGVSSVLNIPDATTISELNVFVDITHTFIGDLEVSLRSPAGTTVILHNLTGSSADNILTWYDTDTVPAQALSAFNGQSAQGDWTLKVRDLAGADVGTINLWQIEILAGAPQPPTIVVAPTSLSFTGFAGGANPPNQTLTVNNSGGGNLSSWSISDNATWLSVSGSGQQTALIQVATAGLAAGTFNGVITVGSTGATNTPVTVPVTLTLTALPPILAVNPTTITIQAIQGTSAPSQVFTVTNAGSGSLSWSASDNADWITKLIPISGTLAAGASASVTATLSTSSKPLGTYTGSITVTSSNAGSSSPKVIACSLQVVPPPTLSVTPTTLAFSGGERSNSPPPSQNLSITNAGGGTLSWTAASNQPWLAPSPTSGAGNNSTVAVSVNTSTLAKGSYTGTVTVTASGAGGSPKTVSVSLNVMDVTAPAQITTLTATPTAAGGTRLAATAVLQSTYSGYPAKLATDNSLTTGWQSGNSTTLRTEWIIADCGSSKTVGSVKLAPRTSYTTCFPLDLEVQTSPDKGVWTTQTAATNQSGTAGVYNDYPFPAGVSARYVRVLITKTRKNGSYFGCQIGEIQVFEPAPSVNNAARLNWTAVGDDGNTGTASTYDIRFSTAPIDESAWGAATQVTGESAPGAAGSAQTFTVTPLSPGTTYYFGIKAIDDSGNSSPLGSTTSTTSVDSQPPGAVTDLKAQEVSGSGAALRGVVCGASSLQAAGYEKERAADGSASTYWASAGSRGARTEFLTLDLGVVQAVGSLRAVPVADKAGLFPTDVSIDVSADGKAWRTVLRDQGPPRTDAAAVEFAFLPAAARFVRLRGLSRPEDSTGNYYLVIAEAEVHGVNGPADSMVSLTWNAPETGAGSAEHYDVRSGAPPLDETAWAGASQAAGEGSPGVPGSPESFLLDGLAPGETVEIGVRVVDDAGNTSKLVTVPWTAGQHGTADNDAPAAANDLRAEVVTGSGRAIAAAALDASSEQSPTYGRDKACDGQLSTAWSTGTPGVAQDEWLMLDLGAEHPVDRLRALPRDGHATLFPVDFRIEVSLDGTRWSTVKNVKGYKAADKTWSVIDFTASVARYVRLVVTKMNTYQGLAYAQIAEVEVWEPSGDVSTLLRVKWSATGDNGRSGRAAEYDLRMSASPITEASWNAATQLPAPSPLSSGGAEEVVVTGLAPAAPYYFGLKIRDEIGNESELSNIGSVTTPR